MSVSAVSAPFVAVPTREGAYVCEGVARDRLAKIGPRFDLIRRHFPGRLGTTSFAVSR